MVDKDKFSEEKLTDDELDKVAGGNADQCADDSHFLNSLNGSTDRYSEFDIAFSAGVYSSEIEAGWATVGIKADVYFAFGAWGKQNRYYLNGSEISQEQARQHAMKVTGHYMNRSEWDW